MCGLGRGLSKTGRLDPDGVELARANLQRFVALGRRPGRGASRHPGDRRGARRHRRPRLRRRDREALFASGSACSRARRRAGFRPWACSPAFPRPPAWSAIWAAARRADRAGQGQCRARGDAAARAAAARRHRRRRQEAQGRGRPAAGDGALAGRTGRSGVLRRRRGVARARPHPHGRRRNIRCTSSRTTRSRATRPRNSSISSPSSRANRSSGIGRPLQEAARSGAPGRARAGGASSSAWSRSGWCSRPGGCAKGISTACSTRPSAPSIRCWRLAPKRRAPGRVSPKWARRSTPGRRRSSPRKTRSSSACATRRRCSRDIAWNEHPDYRAEQAVRHALYMPVAGIDHPGRAFVATALACALWRPRHGRAAGAARAARRRGAAAARSVGLALRLGYTFSGGVPAALAGSSLGAQRQ